MLRTLTVLMVGLLSTLASAKSSVVVENGDWQLMLTDAHHYSLSMRGQSVLQANAYAPVSVRVGNPKSGPEILPALIPASSEWEGSKDGLRVQYKDELLPLEGRVLWKRTLTLTPTAGPLKQDVYVYIGGLLHPAGSFESFVPLVGGVGKSETLPATRAWAFPLTSPIKADAESLAIPLVSFADAKSGLRVTHIADPLFTTEFRMNSTSDGTSTSIEFTYEGSKVPLAEPLTRTFWTVVQNGPPEQAMDAWYATALADVPPGPAWLHDVALQDYDFMSHGGKGWFADIDAAEKLIAPADRSKVVFTLHGWYDMLGRYSFDVKAGKLDDEWTAFPSASNGTKRFPTSESVRMSKAEMHRRIKYAKDRGFRVVVYFADGLTACEGAGLYSKDKLLKWGGWQGPDTVGKPYMQNPAAPEVYKWYVAYLNALLAEYGNEIDGLVWDETFMIRVGSISPPHSRQQVYLAPIFMHLVKELTQITTAYRKDLAFLTSDCQGGSFDEKRHWLDVPPYAIMAHGTYQDSHCSPSTWPYALFANYRNTLWSCNWNAVTHFDYTRFGVVNYGAPVAVTNGWLDDRGLAGLNEEQLQAVIDLFNFRKNKPQHLKWCSTTPPPFAQSQPVR